MTTTGFKSARRKIQNIKNDLVDETTDAVEREAERTAAEAKAHVRNSDTYWRGNLHRSIGSFAQERLERFGGGSRVVIRADVPYAAYVEFGTGPRRSATVPIKHQYKAPTLSPILMQRISDWVFTKPGFMGERSYSTAWAIAATISQKGTYAHPFMRPAWFKGKPRTIQAAENAVSKVVRRS